MEGAQVLLHLIRAEKECSMELHMTAMCEAVVWFRAAGRHAYAKFVPTYVADMIRLKEKKPTVYEHMCDGGLVVKRTNNHLFNSVSTDQALEQTINKEGKSEGGIIGLTLRKGAMVRWLMTRHVTSEFANAFHMLCQDDSNKGRKHEELGTSRKKRDQFDVQKIVDTILNCQNPFDLETVPSELTNIITGQFASPEITKYLTQFLDVGRQRHTEFMNNRLVEGEKSSKFWDAEKRLKIYTFSNMRESLSIDNDKKKLMVDSEVLFRRLLAVSKQRNVNMEHVLQHELAAVSPALFHDDGNMRKCVKADLATKLEGTAETVFELPPCDGRSIYIYDGMALIQGLHEAQFITFKDIAQLILRKVLDFCKVHTTLAQLSLCSIVMMFVSL